jgi:hypothetical protein
MKKDLKYMKDKLEVLGKATPITGPQKDMDLIQKMMQIICTSTQTIRLRACGKERVVLNH